MSKNTKNKNAGFVSFRFAGVDGVTLETAKWVDIFTRQNWNCYFCAGECEFSASQSMVDEKLHFQHKEIASITKRCFNTHVRSTQLTAELHSKKTDIKKTLYKFINSFGIDLLVIQNVLAIPMNIPLSMAVVEVLAETQIPTIAHHHDFYWERERYSVNCVRDILSGCFPPDLSNVVQVTINSLAKQQLGYRTGVSSIVVPNVMEFERPASEADEFSKNLREDFGVSKDDIFVLQPTRIVQRKGIEHAIELVRRMGSDAKLVISHSSGDEGDEYQERVLEYAKLLGVPVLLGDGRVGEERSVSKDGKKIYSLEDVYHHADIVTYPSLREGFGNAFLEAVYYRVPIVINLYPVYAIDIRPKGFQCIEFDNFISHRHVDMVHKLLADKAAVQAMVSANYDLALKHYSFELLEKKLVDIFTTFFGL